ncbi:MAG: MFS transporter [Thermomicrobia bacterium]|nr:MFS transporter [Thermomicrobia bacterium]MCA1724503.1 MFS transporter [Thermomicrobia bacterium]
MTPEGDTADRSAKRPLYQRILADTRPLQESPAYRRLWTGAALSSVGNTMTRVAVPIQVYALTHSSLAVGMIGLVVAVPLIGLGLVGGAIADAFDRRRLVMVTTTFLAVISLLFAGQAMLDLRQLWLLYVLIAVQSCLAAIDQPARRTFVPRLLPPGRIPAASALSFLSFQVSNTVGPLVAGAIIAFAGLQTAYVVDAVSFFFSFYGVLRLPAMPPHHDGARPGLRAVVEGLRFVRRQPVIAAALLVDLNATIFGMPFALFPALAVTHFGGGPQTVGLLYAAPAIGGVVCSAFSGPLSHLHRQGRAILIAVALWGAAIAGFGATHRLWLGVVLLAVAGGADVVNGVFRTTIIQVNTPDALQGRVNSLAFVVGAGGPRLGDVESGLVASLTSPVFSAVSGGLASMIGVTFLGLLRPTFARYDARIHITTEPH